MLHRSDANFSLPPCHAFTAGISKGSVVVDLGSGDGILLVAGAKKGALAIGYELSM